MSPSQLHRLLPENGDVPAFAASDQRGFSLVELMVALAIASVLLGALGIMFVNTSNARGDLDRSSRQVESGRYAMQVLGDEIRHAGYYGALANPPPLGASVTQLPDACASALATVQDSIGIPLQGYAGQSSAANLDSGKLACIDAAAGYKPNTAVLVVRRASTATPIAKGAMASGNFYIQTSGCPGDLSRYVLDSYANTASFSLHSNGSPGCFPITSAPEAKVTPYLVRIYYISTCSGSDCSAGGADTVPTLKRIDITPGGASAPVAVVDGIENLQLEYGIDTTAAPGDGSPDVYKAAPLTLAEWQNVMAVRVHVLARNLEASSGFKDTKTYALGPVSVPAQNDAFRRHAYSQLVRLYNPSQRRE
jgi:type IV pilus assembly protein PilW